MMVHTYTNLQYTTTLSDVQEKVQLQRQQQSLYSRKNGTWSLLRNCINQGMTFHIEYDVFIHNMHLQAGVLCSLSFILCCCTTWYMWWCVTSSLAWQLATGTAVSGHLRVCAKVCHLICQCPSCKRERGRERESYPIGPLRHDRMVFPSI